MTHANFDLLFSKSGATYHVRVVDSPHGSASAQFTSPFTEDELENLMLRVAQPRHATRRAPLPQASKAKIIGGKLFEAVFTSGVRDCLRGSLRDITAQRGLRIRLRLTEVPEIAGWPWEFLYDTSLDRFLALSIDTPIVRFLELPEPIEPLQATPPLRILLMVASPTDHVPLNVEQEVKNVFDALTDLRRDGLVAVDRVDVATLGNLQRALSRGTYHIFHFIGHGVLAPGASEGELIFEDDQNRGRPVGASRLGALLHDHRSLRVAVLNACEGARSVHDNSFSGAAQSLVRQGIPAVVAMQYEITDGAAVCFSHEFYASLAFGRAIDHSVAEARKAILAESELEWATPVLFLRSDDARIFAPGADTPLDRPSARSPAVRVGADLHDRAEPARPGVERTLAWLGFGSTDRTAVVAWGSLTFAALLAAVGLATWGVRLRWFNVTSVETLTASLGWVGPISGLILMIATGFAYLMTGRGRVSAARVARWVALTSRGTPSAARLLVYMAIAGGAAWWIQTLPPTLMIVTRPGGLPDEVGWEPARRRTGEREELVYREVRWLIGAGSGGGDLRLNVRLRPPGTVSFGRVHAIATTAGHTVTVPPLGSPEPLEIVRLGATSPDNLGGLRFTIVQDLTAEGQPSYVEVDVQIVKNGTAVASLCQALPAQFVPVAGDAGPRDCSAVQ